MSEPSGELRRVNWFECFGFVRIFRSFWVAFQWSTLLPAFFGVFVTYFAGHVLDFFWSESCQPAVISGTHELDVFLMSGSDAETAVEKWMEGHEPQTFKRVGIFALLENHAKVTVNEITNAVPRTDLAGMIDGVKFGFGGALWLVSMHTWYAILFFVLFVLIWGFFGGMVCRAAAMDLCYGVKIGCLEAAAYAKARFWKFAISLLLPVAIMMALALCLYLLGLLGAIPWLGELFVSVLFFLVLLVGGLIAFVLIGWVAAAPLFTPAIATDDLDATEACHVNYTYIYYHPWRTVFYSLVAICYGAVYVLFFKFFVTAMLWAVGLFMGASMNYGDAFALSDGEAVRVESKLDVMWQAPSFFDGRPFYGTFDGQELRFPSSFARWLIQFWINMLWAFVAAFVVSFFYSASCIIYVLLRGVHDDTDMEEIYIDTATEESP